MTKEYVKPSIEVLELESADIIKTSGGIVLPDDEW